MPRPLSTCVQGWGFRTPGKRPSITGAETPESRTADDWEKDGHRALNNVLPQAQRSEWETEIPSFRMQHRRLTDRLIRRWNERISGPNTNSCHPAHARRCLKNCVPPYFIYFCLMLQMRTASLRGRCPLRKEISASRAFRELEVGKSDSDCNSCGLYWWLLQARRSSTRFKCVNSFNRCHNSLSPPLYPLGDGVQHHSHGQAAVRERRGRSRRPCSWLCPTEHASSAG